MGKVKKGTIFKIFLVTLLIILSTIGTVSAAFVEESSFGGTSALSDAVGNDTVGYETLDTNPGVFCDQQGDTMQTIWYRDKNGGILSSNPDVHGTIDSKTHFENATTQHNYQPGGTQTPTAEEAYIMAHIPSSQSSHYTPAQRAWWNRGDSAWGNENDANELNNSNKTMIEKLKEKKVSIPNLSEEQIDWINRYNNVEALYEALQEKGEKVFGDRYQEVDDIIFSCVKELYGGYGERPEGEEQKEITKEEIKESISTGKDLSSEAKAFAKYASEMLNGTELKSKYKESINDDKVEVFFDQQYNAWLVGPLTITYPDYEPFAGITGTTLKALNRNEEKIELEYDAVANVNEIQAGKYTFVKENENKDGFAKFSASKTYYPNMNEEFYIAIGYSNDILHVSDFGFTTKYLCYSSAGYTVYGDGTYYGNYTWKTTLNVKYYNNYYYWDYNKNDWSTTTVQKYIQKEIPDVPGYMDSNFDSTIRNNWPTSLKNYKFASYGWYEISETVSKGTNPKLIADDQNLVEVGHSEVFYKEGGDAIEIAWEKTIDVTKVVKTENGEEINPDQEFDFLVVMELLGNEKYEHYSSGIMKIGEKQYMIVHKDKVKAGKTVPVTLPPIYLSDFNGVYPEYFIVETDQFGKSYAEWEEEQNEESYWKYYKPVNDGVETGDVVNLTNTKKAEHSHIRVDKKIKAEDANGDETAAYFQIRYGFDDNSSEMYYIKLVPSTEKAYFEFHDQEGNFVGYCETGVENGYAFAKFTSLPIEWTSAEAPTFWVEELYEGMSYQEYSEKLANIEKEISKLNATDILSLSEEEKYELYAQKTELYNRKHRLEQNPWSKFDKPEIKNIKGSFEDYVCECDKENADYREVKAAVTRVTNKLRKTIPYNLELFKYSEYGDDQYEANFDVMVEAKSKDTTGMGSGYTAFIGTFTVTANSNKPVYIKDKINDPNKDYNYFITISEQQNEWIWKDVRFDGDSEYIEVDSENDMHEIAAQNSDKWVVLNEDGIIIKATKLLNNNNNDLNITAINGLSDDNIANTGLVIEKTVEDLSENEYPDAFYFKLQNLRHGGYSDWDAVTALFTEDNLIETDNNGIIIKVSKNENNEYRLVSNIISIDKNGNPKEVVPNVKLIEVDQHGEEYSANPTYEDSIWNEFTPKETEVIKSLKVYNSFEVAIAAMEAALAGESTDNDLTVLHFTNYKKYDANLKIIKTIANGKEWTENTKFYFQVAKVGIDNELEYITDQIFADEYIAKDGYYGQNPAIVLTKDRQEVESEFISWSAKLSNNTYAIFEVDQHGELYDPKKENVKSDSTWNDYAPSDNKGYIYFTFEPGNSVTYDVTFENIAQEGTITINKVIENSEFLEEEKFYFQVVENGKDVTKELFNEENLVTENNETYVLVEKADETNGVTSKEQLGNHTYTITEYDKNHVTFEEYQKGTKSDFWGKGFVPSNNGEWTVELNSSEGPSFVKAVNYRVVDELKVVKEISGDIDEDDYNQEFKAKLSIIPNKYTGRIWLQNKDGKYQELDWSYTKDITLTPNNPAVIGGIAWEGEGPIVVASEFGLPENWVKEGLDQEAIVLDANKDVIELVIKNEKQLDDYTLQIIKNIVDTKGNLVSLIGEDGVESNDADLTFYFDVLAKNIDDEAIVVDNKTIGIEGTEVDGYTRLLHKYPVVVEEGKTSGTITIKSLDGKNIEYKVIEVDENGEPYSENPSEDSLWNKTKPTTLKDGKLVEHNGIWTGELTDEAVVAQIDAYNVIRKVDIFMTKTVYENGNPVDMEENESFDYIAEFSNGVTEKFTIVYEENAKGKASTWPKEFILDLDETLTYTITEVDEKGDSFENRTEDSVFWSMFEPVDGKGIETGTVEPGTNPEIRLSGKNKRIENLYGQLEVKKITDVQENEKFYFVVEQNGENVTGEIFDTFVNLAEDGEQEINAIEVISNSDSVKSKIQVWDKYEKAPKFNVIEVDQYGEEYSGKPTHEDSLWNSWEPKNKDGKEVTLKGYEKVDDTFEAVGTTIHDEENTKIIKKPFTIIKTINGGPIIDGENFYFIIKKNGVQVTGETLRELFPDAVIDNDKIRLYKEEGKDAVDTATSIAVRMDEDIYTVTEVDQHGKLCTDKNLAEDSLWHEYGVDNNGTWKVTELQPDIQIDNKVNSAEILIVKEFKEGQEWRDGLTYNFSIFVNEKEYEIELTKDNPSSEPIEVKWNSIETAPEISVKENNGKPIKITLNGEEYTSDQKLVPNTQHKYTFEFENGMDEGYLKVTKKLVEGAQSDETYKFEYKYSNEDEPKYLEIKAGETVETEPAQWEHGTPAPTFTIKEIDKVPETVTTTVKDTEKITNDNGDVIGISGTLSKGTNGVVDVTFVNAPEITDYHSGSLNVVKTFSTEEKINIINKDENDTKNKDLFTQLIEAYGKDYKFTFTLSIEPGDENSTFIIGDTEYPRKDGNSKYEDSIDITLSDFVKMYRESESDEFVFDIFKDVNVTWPEGSKAPSYKVVESANEEFWQGSYSEGSSFKEDETITVTINNAYKVTEKWDLTTRMAGIVWKDASVPNKQDKNNVEGGADGRYLPDNEIDGIRDELITENVYVRILRVIYDESGNVARDENGNPMTTYNSEDNQFIYDRTEEYFEVTDGTWNFNKVSVPAFTENDAEKVYGKDNIYSENDDAETKANNMNEAINMLFDEGYRIKYDVEFFYDGITYQPTEKLVIEENGELVSKTAEDYRKDSDNEQYFISSSAIDDLTDRKEFNEKYTTVKADTVMQENGDSTGKLDGDEDGISADIKYKGNIENGAIVSKNISTGTLDLGVTSENYEQKLMKATTGNAGLTYFFEGEMLVKDEDGNMKYAKGDGQYIRLTPGNCNGYYEDRSVNTDADCVVIGKHYKKIYDYALNINLGLVEKQKIDLELEKDICAVTVIVNENAHVYELNTAKEQSEITFTESQKEELDNFFNKLENDTNVFNVYTSDYNYRVDVYDGTSVKTAYDEFYSALYHYDNVVEDLIKTKELQIYLTYGITIANRSAIYDAQIHSIADYYDDSLTFVDVKTGYEADYIGGEHYERVDGESVNVPGLYTYVGEADDNKIAKLTNVMEKYDWYYTDSFNENEFTEIKPAGTVEYENKDGELIEYSFNRATILLPEESTDDKEYNKITHNDDKTYYVTYRVNAIDQLTYDRLSLGNKVNIAEINEFSTTYTTEYANVLGYTDPIPATAFDKDSAPGNYNFAEYPDVFEDDTDYARVNLGTTTTPRTLSGIAWLDNESEDNNYNGQILGDGIYKAEDDYVIENINTQLVEVIDLPVINEEGDITSDYNEYEFYWDNSATETNEFGEYTFNKMIRGDRLYDGLIPGNFIVRFFYGDQDTIIRDSSGNEIDYQGLELTKINGVDYKTTEYKAGEKNVEDKSISYNDDLYVNNEWHNVFDINYITDNEARDSEARRLEIIAKTQTLNNYNTTILNNANYADNEVYALNKGIKNGFEINSTDLMRLMEISEMDLENLDDDVKDEYSEIITRIIENNYEMFEEYKDEYDELEKKLYGELDLETNNGNLAYETVKGTDGYSMFADTAKMNLKVERANDIKASEGYNILGINLGLEERSKTEFYLDKQIKEITLIKDEKTFFHVEYDIEYSNNKDDGKFEQVDDKLWVKLTPVKETLVGEENLQSLNDEWTADSIRQGFRYINIDSTLLQGLNLEIKYEISVINLSETDTYGPELDGLDDFAAAINELYSPEYTLEYADIDDGRLYRRGTEEYKTYGKYLGHTYYQGFIENGWGENELIVTTKVREIVDYIDNDIKVDTAEVGQNWDIYTDTTKLEGKVDKNIYRNVGKTDELAIMDEYENPYSTILVSTDSAEANADFMAELEPFAKTGDINKSKAKIGLTTSKLFAGTDEGRTGMDNLIEIVTLENTVGRRDMKTVYGNYNPYDGATQTTERDESSTELVTLSPPTGNIENDRQFITYIAILLTIAALAGAGVGIKLKISGKSKKSDKTE